MDVENILLPGEQILFRSVAVPKKGSKSLLGIIIIVAFSLIPFIAFSEANGIYGNIIMIIAVSLLFMGLAIYFFVYNFILKKVKIKDQEYFITNKRAIIYLSKKNEFKIGYLDRFDEFRVDNEKNNYGDVYMGIVTERSGDNKDDFVIVGNTLFNPDKNNMNFIYFESIENPYRVMEIAKKQRINLVPDSPLLNTVEEGTKETKIGGQKIIIYNQPMWVWILYSAVIIVLLAIPIFNIISSLKVWNSYIKTSAVITNIETKGVGGYKRQDIKYFVNVSYKVNNNTYKSVITNDTCYLKLTQNFKGYTSSCRKYGNYFKNMRENDKVVIYVNPNKLTEVEYIPTLLSGSSLILLIFSLICSLPLLAKIKSKTVK